MADDLRSAVTTAIQGVTDGWDEPLDEVHDVPPIVNALAAAGLLADPDHDVEVGNAAVLDYVTHKEVATVRIENPEDIRPFMTREIARAKAEAWDAGYTSGHSRAMRKMSDEPNIEPGINPYRPEVTP